MTLATALKNSLFTIEPYWQGRTWVFDAPDLGLFAEPFVAGADVILTQLAHAYLGIEPEVGAKFQLIFSQQGFPGFQLCFQRQNAEYDGFWYVSEAGSWGWLCPATLCFFPEGFPETLYVEVRKSLGSF